MESTQFFTHDRGFLPITFTSRNAILFFFNACKAIDSLSCVPNFLLSHFYLNLLFNFKVGPLSDLSCLMSSMFIVPLVIRIIKTKCFNNTILIAEFEGKTP